MYAQMVMERLCAVMAGTDVHAVAAQYLADIVGMYLVYGKGNDAGMVILPVRTQHMDVRTPSVKSITFMHTAFTSISIWQSPLMRQLLR